jgi:type IV fimbrial biogenesis protein FimT
MSAIHTAAIGRRRREGGITVIELLIGVSALALILMFVLPGSGAVLDRWHIHSAASQLQTGLMLARTESEARSSIVRLCPSSNGHTCRSDGNWNLGWLVYTDGNADGRVQDIERLRTFKAPASRVRIYANGAINGDASFTATGLKSDEQEGRFLICARDSNAPPRAVRVDAEGWVTPVPADNEACISG